MDVEAILSRLVQVGTVTDVDILKRKVRVKFQDANYTSGWLFVLQHYGAGLYIKPDGEHSHNIADTYSGSGSASTEPAHDHTGSFRTYWMPKVNDTVVVLYTPVRDGDGFVLGGI